MRSLRELQIRFAAGLDNDALAPLEHVCAEGAPARERFAVYRNNVRESLIDALAAVYPVVQKLVGERFFRQTARQYLRAHPSRSGNLHDFGAELPAFLAALRTLDALPYLPDVARLEWAWHHVYHAPDARARLEPGRLAAIPEEDWPQLRFRVHPATALVASPFPVLHIWLANQDRASDDERISLDEGGDQLLVMRPLLDVEIRRLSAGEHALLVAMAGGRPLERAYEAGVAAEPAFDLAGALSLLIQQGVLTGFSPDPARPHIHPESDDVHLH